MCSSDLDDEVLVHVDAPAAVAAGDLLGHREHPLPAVARPVRDRLRLGGPVPAARDRAEAVRRRAEVLVKVANRHAPVRPGPPVVVEGAQNVPGLRDPGQVVLVVQVEGPVPVAGELDPRQGPGELPVGRPGRQLGPVRGLSEVGLLSGDGPRLLAAARARQGGAQALDLLLRPLRPTEGAVLVVQGDRVVEAELVTLLGAPLQLLAQGIVVVLALAVANLTDRKSVV